MNVDAWVVDKEDLKEGGVEEGKGKGKRSG